MLGKNGDTDEKKDQGGNGEEASLENPKAPEEDAPPFHNHLVCVCAVYL